MRVFNIANITIPKIEIGKSIKGIDEKFKSSLLKFAFSTFLATKILRGRYDGKT